jgi:hypothetical protein
MNTRIEIDGCPISIKTRESENGFRTEILATTGAGPQTTSRLFERATAWSRELSAGRDNSSVHCFRDGETIVVESLGAKATPEEFHQLVQQLTAPPTRTAGAAADERNDSEMALTG